MTTEEDVPPKNAEIAKGQAERVAERDGRDAAPIDALRRQSPERDGGESQLRPPKRGQIGPDAARKDDTCQSKASNKIDGRTAPAKRRRALIAAYEAQIGSSLSPATRSLIARAVSIEITLEGIEADQVAGKPYDAEKHARLAGSYARLLDRLGLTVRPGVPAASDLSVDTVIREPARQLAQERATREGWTDAERDRYVEKLVQQAMAAA